MIEALRALRQPTISLIADAAANTTAASITATVTGSRTGLLVVAARCNQDRASSMAPTWTTTTGSIGTPTVAGPVTSGVSNAGTVILWAAPVSGWSGTAGASWTSGVAGRVCAVCLVTGHDPHAPIRQTAAGWGAVVMPHTMPSSLCVMAGALQDADEVTPHPGGFFSPFWVRTMAEIYDAAVNVDRRLFVHHTSSPGWSGALSVQDATAPVASAAMEIMRIGGT